MPNQLSPLFIHTIIKLLVEKRICHDPNSLIVLGSGCNRGDDQDVSGDHQLLHHTHGTPECTPGTRHAVP